MKPSTPDEIMDAALDALRLEIEQATGCFTRHLAEQLENVPLPPYERQALAVQYWATVMRAVMHRFAVFAGHEYPEGYAHHGSMTEVCRMTHDMQLKRTPKCKHSLRPQRFSIQTKGGAIRYGVMHYDASLNYRNRPMWSVELLHGWTAKRLGEFYDSPWPIMLKIMTHFELSNFQWLDSDMNWPSHEEYLASLRD